MITQDANKDI